MKGNNSIEMNEATLIEAVQLLLDRDAPGAGKVTSVKAAPAGSSYERQGTFTVSLTVEESK